MYMYIFLHKYKKHILVFEMDFPYRDQFKGTVQHDAKDVIETKQQHTDIQFIYYENILLESHCDVIATCVSVCVRVCVSWECNTLYMRYVQATDYTNSHICITFGGFVCASGMRYDGEAGREWNYSLKYLNILL